MQYTVSGRRDRISGPTFSLRTLSGKEGGRPHGRGEVEIPRVGEKKNDNNDKVEDDPEKGWCWVFFSLLYPNLAVEMKAVDKAEETNDQSTCCSHATGTDKSLWTCASGLYSTLHSLIPFNEWATSHYRGWTKMPSGFFLCSQHLCLYTRSFSFFWKCPKNATSSQYSNTFFFFLFW